MRRVILLMGVLLILVASGCEQEGMVKYDDCREVISVKAGDLQTYYKKFICQYTRRASGKIVAGTCVHVSTSFFSGKCETAYVYTFLQEPDSGCTKQYPYLGNDGMCYKDWEQADRSMPKK